MSSNDALWLAIVFTWMALGCFGFFLSRLGRQLMFVTKQVADMAEESETFYQDLERHARRPSSGGPPR